MRQALFSALVLAGCRTAVVAEAPAEPAPVSEPTQEPEQASTPAAPAHAPGLVVRDDGENDIKLYAMYLVDASGELGTRALWPHSSDCPDVEPPPHTIPAGGEVWLPPPEVAFDGTSCTPTPLPPGDYVVRAHTGYGENFYAAAEITLPLKQAIELELEVHEDPPACDETRARRAATLALDVAGAHLPPHFMDGCDLARARCGSLPLEDTMPPQACTITLHETLLRVERPAQTDSVQSLDVWVDSAVVYARQFDLRATSASRVAVDGKPIVIAGETGRARHEHGGPAAKLGLATFEVHNPLDREVAVRARAVEFLTDHACELPAKVRAKPKVLNVSPASVAPGRSRLDVSFEAQSAYQGHCDRFAARVTFSVEGHRVPVTVEYEVSRFEPLRRHRERDPTL
ncbi:MAG: hypothetical protein AAGA54_36110 [Myxococcota bacterium]